MSGNPPADRPAYVPTLILTHAVETPDHVALVAPAARGWTRVTYGALGDRAARVASGLRKRGVGHGDRVVLLVPMSPELYVVMLAVVSLGATAVFVEPKSSIKEIARVVGVARPRAFIGIPKAHVLRAVNRSIAQVPVAIAVAPRLVARALAADALADVERDGHGATAGELLASLCLAADEPALLTFSSGSTGTPKGAPRTNEYLLAQHSAIESLLACSPRCGDVHMSAFAIVLLSTIASGATAVIPRMGRGGVDDVDGAGLAAAVAELGVTLVSGSPAFLGPMFEHSARTGQALAGVRRVVSGGAPVPLDLCDHADHRTLPDGSFVVVYGSTEAEPISTIPAAEVRAETGERTQAGAGLCVGRLDSHLELRLLRCTAGPLEVGPGGIDGLSVGDGEIGEVSVSGPHVNRGYYRNAAAERQTKITDERGVVWHRTGDAAYLDHRQRLWIVGRVADIVQRGGESYHPAAVEAAAQSLAFVRRAALIEDGRGGTILVVEPRRRRAVLFLVGSRAGEVKRRMRERGVVVDRVRFTSRLPVDSRHRAKLDYRAIRRAYSSASDASA